MNKLRHRKKRNSLFFRLVTAAAIAAAAFGLFRGLINRYPEARNEYIDAKLEAACPKEIDGIPMTSDFVPVGSRARTGQRRRILYVVVHETDNEEKGANAKAHNKFIHENGKTEPLSWHYTVDDHEIYHHLPDDETAYHAGDQMEKGGGNYNGIGVEMCVNADGDYEQTLKNAAKLVAYLVHNYGLTIDDVKKHQDFSGKQCPHRLITQGRWGEFIGMVKTDLTKY